MLRIGILIQETVPDEAIDTILAATPARAPAPLFDGPATILWIVVAACVVIFFSVIYLMMRARVLREARTQKAARTKYFHPAGAEAEITFDDEHPADTHHLEDDPHDPRGGHEAEYDNDGLAEVVIERPGETSPFEESDQNIAANGLYADRNEASDTADRMSETPEAPRKKSGAFGGLFSKKNKKRQADASASADHDTTFDEQDPHDLQPANDEARPGAFFSARQSQSEPQFRDHAHQQSDDLAYERRQAEALRQEAEAEAAEIRRQAELDAHRLQEEQHRIAAEREAEFERQRLAQREAELREADFEARKREAALSQQQHAHMQTDDAAIESAISRALEGRFSEIEARLATNANHAGVAQDAGAMAGADLIAQRLKDHREAVDTALQSMNERLNQIAEPAELEALRADIADLRNTLTIAQPSAGARAQTPHFTSPSVQLGDILRNALPPDAYQFDALLANNRKADCLILLPRPPGPVAVDASFPLEAWSALQRSMTDRENNETAENEFRRAALRHVVNIAERLIIPEQTAESALMFIPSEQVYAEIHTHFPDVVQDSYRARVWIVSPTTLMATLHTIRAILRDADVRTAAASIHEEATHVLGEVDDLRGRVADLEKNFDQTRSNVRDVLTSTDQVWRRAEKITRSGNAINAQKNSPDFDRDGRYAISTHDTPQPGATAPSHPAPQTPHTPPPEQSSYAPAYQTTQRSSSVPPPRSTAPSLATPSSEAHRPAAQHSTPDVQPDAPSFGYRDQQSAPSGYGQTNQNQSQERQSAPAAPPRARPAPQTTLSRPTDPDLWDKDAVRRTDRPSFPLR